MLELLGNARYDALRTFSFSVANGSAGLLLLRDIDYQQMMIDEPSMLEISYAIFAARA